MARKLREKSPTGYYHIMTRGIDKQIIFEDNKDKENYLKFLKESKDLYDIIIVAYCLMLNHVHLIVYDKGGELSRFMQSLNRKYAGYFNFKYDRIGPLFHDRYRSEIIKDERQLTACYRYVMNNPYAAGIAKAWDYNWSSYKFYSTKSNIVDTTIIRGIIGSESLHKQFIKTYSEDHFLDVPVSRFTDEEAKLVVERILNISQGTKILNYNKNIRDKALAKLKSAGLTKRQIQRLTGASPSIIRNA